MSPTCTFSPQYAVVDEEHVMTTPRRRPHLRLASAILTIPVATAMALALMPAASASSGAASVQVKTSTIKTLTPGRGLSSGPTVRLFAPLKLGAGTYSVEMPVTVKHTNPDAVDYVDVSLICKDNYGHMNEIGQAVNTLHGTTFTLDPRFYITLTGPDRGVCVGYAYEGRIHGNASASPSTRRLTIVSAKLIVTRSSSSVTQTLRFKGNTAADNHPYVGHSSRVSKGVHFHAAPAAFKASPSRQQSFSVMGTVFLTACISTGGSRDATTDGKNLCTAASVKTGGSGPLVRTRLLVQQYKPDGTTVCQTVVVPNTTTTFHIPALRHHLPVALQGTVTVPVKAGCGSHLKAYTEVYVESAPSVVVHFPSSVTSVLPA
jgi:hypothetical protein